MRALLAARTGKGNTPSLSIALSLRMPVVVSSEAPTTFSTSCGWCSTSRPTSSAPSSTMISGPVSKVRCRYRSNSSSVGSWVAKTRTSRSASAAQTSSWVESGLLPATVTSAPAFDKSSARYAVFASRWMVMAIFRPRSAPSASWFSEMVFRTGECWATQSILRCPSGARAGSLTMESSITTRSPFPHGVTAKFSSAPQPVYSPSRARSVCFCRLNFVDCLGEHRSLAPLAQHPFEHLRTVGHYDVDAEVEEAVHLARLIYRPDVYPYAPVVGSIHQAGRDHLAPPVLDRYLQGVIRRVYEELQVQPAQPVEVPDLLSGSSSRDTVLRQLPYALHDCRHPGDDEDAVPGTGIFDGLEKGHLHAGLLFFDVYIHFVSGELTQDLPELRHLHALAPVRIGVTSV